MNYAHNFILKQTSHMMEHERVTIVVATLRRLLKKKGGLNLYCKFFWLGQEYRTGTYRNEQNDSEVDIMEKFTIDIYPSISKLFKLQVVDEHDMGPVVIGQLALDLGELQSKVSDGFYDLLPPSREDAPREKGMYGRIRLRLTKEETKADPILELSSVLPNMEDGTNKAITDEERRALYDKNKLKAAQREDSQKDIKKVDIKTGGKAVAAFWEIKSNLPNVDDNRIHAALQQFDYNMSEALEFLVKKEMKEMRENRPMEFIDLNEEDRANQELEQERHIDRQKHFLQANAGELMDVPLFSDGYKCKPSHRYKALIMGLGYPGIDEINCRERSLRDAKMVNNWVRDACGWTLDNCIYMIHDNHPDSRCTGTKQNIIDGFRWLVKDVGPGDALFLSFSGHGGMADPITNKSHMESCPGFDGLRPYWYTNDMKILDVATIYKEVLFALPAGVRITFLVDSPNFHLWQPFFFNPRSLHFAPTTHRYFLPCDVRVFCSIGDSSLSSISFTQIFCSIACSKQQEKASMYDFLFTLCERARDCYGDAPLKLFKDYICRSHHYTACQEIDLRVEFSLHDVVPNCNMRLGPSMVHGHDSRGGNPLPHILTREEARAREEKIKARNAPTSSRDDGPHRGVFVKLKTKLKEKESRQTARKV